MAPEQVSGGTVDSPSDVFGASVVFWEMLTGVRLFDGADEGEIYGKVVRTEVKRPSQVVQGVDRKTDAIVLRGLARSQGKRYESARAMALAIEAALAAGPAVPGRPVGGAPDGGRDRRAPAADRRAGGRDGRRRGGHGDPGHPRGGSRGEHRDVSGRAVPARGGVGAVHEARHGLTVPGSHVSPIRRSSHPSRGRCGGPASARPWSASRASSSWPWRRRPASPCFAVLPLRSRVQPPRPRRRRLPRPRSLPRRLRRRRRLRLRPRSRTRRRPRSRPPIYRLPRPPPGHPIPPQSSPPRQRSPASCVLRRSALARDRRERLQG